MAVLLFVIVLFFIGYVIFYDSEELTPLRDKFKKLERYLNQENFRVNFETAISVEYVSRIDNMNNYKVILMTDETEDYFELQLLHYLNGVVQSKSECFQIKPKSTIKECEDVFTRMKFELPVQTGFDMYDFSDAGESAEFPYNGNYMVLDTKIVSKFHTAPLESSNHFVVFNKEKITLQLPFPNVTTITIFSASFNGKVARPFYTLKTDIYDKIILVPGTVPAMEMPFMFFYKEKNNLSTTVMSLRRSLFYDSIQDE